MFKRLDDKVMVAGQLQAGDLAEAAAEGITLVINNRPDDEEPGQPSGAEIGAAAKQAGLEYYHLPISNDLMPIQVNFTATMIKRTDGKALLFCRSGTRSTFLWALARSKQGADGEALIASAKAAGYDLEPLRRHLCRPRVK